MIELANPAALLWLALLLPVLLAAACAARRRRDADEAFGGSGALRRGRGPWRRPLQQLLLLGALVLAVIAGARPQWGSEERELTRLGIDIAIALDISRSMTASDVEPSRAGAAAAALDELLNHLRGDRVGLVTFAGDAFERSPLTLDLEALRQLIARAQNEAALVRQGTDLGSALDASLRLLDIEDAAETQVVMLISDGEDLAGELGPALERAAERGVRVFSVAAGTAAGGAMAAREDGESSGGELSQADRSTLRGIAEVSGGELRELDELVALAVEFQRLRQSTFDEGTDEAPIERFQWFLGGSLALLGLQALVAEGGWRRRLRTGRLALGGAALAAVALIAACGSTEFRHVDDGNSAYLDGRHDEALASYRNAAELVPEAPELPYNIGNALHQLDRYEEATVASTAAMNAAEDTALFTRSTYALGSHAFRRDDLESAREAWTSVLLRDPDDADAKHNLELTLRLLAGDDADERPPLTPRGGDGELGSDGSGDNVPGEDEMPPDGAEQDDGQAPDDLPPDESDGDQPLPSNPDSSGSPDAAQGAEDAQQPPATLEDAQSQLSDAVLLLGDEALTLDDAISLLDLVRLTNELEALEPRRGGAGGLPDR